MELKDLKSKHLKEFFKTTHGTIEYDAQYTLENSSTEEQLIAKMLLSLDTLQNELTSAVRTVLTGAKEINVQATEIRAHVESIKTIRVIDDNPDLSYLKTSYSDYYGEDGSNWLRLSKEDKQKVIKKYGSLQDASIVYMAQDEHRLQEYYEGKWHMLGISAEATVLIPAGSEPPTYKIQKITSGGLWGIESDSNEEYLKQVEKEQVDELRGYLRILNVKGADEIEVTGASQK